MIEVFFVIYLFSGLIKAYLNTFRIDLPIDFTLISALLLIVAVAIERRQLLGIEAVKKLMKHKVIQVFLLFWAWMGITNLYSVSESYSTYKTIVFGTNLVALIVPVFAGQPNYRRIGQTIFTLAFVLGTIFFFLYPITLYARPYNYPMLDFDSFSSIYQAVGIMVSLSIIFMLTRRIGLVRLMGLNVMIWILLYSGSRGSMIFLAMTVLFMFGVKYKQVIPWIKQFDPSRLFSRKALVGLFLLTVMNAGYVWIVVNNVYPSKVHYRSFARLGLAFDSLLESSERDNAIRLFSLGSESSAGAEAFEEIDESDRNTSITARIYHYRFSIEKIFKSLDKTIFGYGVGSYGVMFTGKDSRGYPHNILLETWFEIGLIGVVLLIYFIIAYIKNFQYNNLFVFAALIFLLLNLMKSSSLVDIRLIFGILACTLIPINSIEKKPDSA
jgi:hypothetical protein